MTDLSQIKSEDLQAELQRRTQELLDSLKPQIRPVDFPNFKPLVDMCVDYEKDVQKRGWDDEDWTQYIYECALTCVFGDKIFNHLKKLQKE